MDTPNKKIILAVLLAALLSLSCSLPVSLGNKIKEALFTETPTAEITQTAVIQPTVAPVESTIPAVSNTLEAAIQSLTNSVIGNDTSMLDNYRTTFTVTSSGTDSTGNAISQIIDMESEILNAQSTEHTLMRFEGTGAAAVTSQIEMYQQENRSFMYYPDNDLCLSVGNAGDLQSNPYFSQDDFLQSIEVGSLVESNVIVNDVATDHYQVNNSILDEGNLTFQNAEIWVAREGGYIVRFTGQASGEISDGINSGSGTVGWTYDLLDAGKVTEIVIPETCLNQQKTLENIPIPDNATDVQSYNEIITYNSSDAPDVIRMYYQETLVAQGWVITDDMNTAGVIMLSAQKDNNDVQIMISPAGNSGSAVIITMIALH